MDLEERARAAKHLRDSEAFQLFMSEVRDDAIKAFTASGIDQSDIREEAHSTLRTLNKIVGKLDAAVADQTNMQKRLKKHVRKNDR